MQKLFDLLRKSPESISAGRVAQHAIINHSFTDWQDAFQDDCKWNLSLDGIWDFNVYKNPTEVDLNAKFEHKITVPGCWDMQGFFAPAYTNVVLPFVEFPFDIPLEKNPTGVYYRTFELPEDWDGKKIVLHFDGVENFFAPFLNGELLGYVKDSRGASDFDITNSVKAGKNELKVVVSQFSDAAYMEDQDQWWHAGIVRKVYLQAMPKNHIFDVFAATTLDSELKNGEITLELLTSLEPSGDFCNRFADGYMAPKPGNIFDNWSYETCLYDGDSIIWSYEYPVGKKYDFEPFIPFKDPKLIPTKFHAVIPDIQPWSCENPKRYSLLVKLKNGEEIIDSTLVKIGFRRVEIKKRQLLINGKAVLINGMNRHEHHPETGRTLTTADIVQDIKLMKQFNVNAIRTSHYPNMPEFYDICDEYGMYVFDESNIETHAYFNDICRNPIFASAFMSRTVDMVTRDKNHPSIIVWSLGNESGFGPHHAAMYNWVKVYDKSRIVMYERATTDDLLHHWEPDFNREYTDIIAPMYPSVKPLINWANYASPDDRPLIVCEYSHAMGNSNGGLKDYYDVFKNCYGVQGGFIWEWCDHGIYKTDENGNKNFCYGGDFGEEVHDSNFVTDGLVSPDRKPHPALYEFKKLAQPVKITLVDAATKKIMIENLRYFTDLDDCELVWRVAMNGEVFASGVASTDGISPQGFVWDMTKEREERALFSIKIDNSKVIKLDFAYPQDIYFNSICTLDAEIQLKHDTCWAKKGHIIGYEQFILPVIGNKKLPEVDYIEMPTELSDIIKNGAMNIWRPTLDNDVIKRNIKTAPCDHHRCAALWYRQGFNEFALKEKKNLDNGEILSVYGIGNGKELLHFMSMSETAVPNQFHMKNRFVIPEGVLDLPRLGLIFELPKDFSHADYFGLGPMENYRDRKYAAKLGNFSLDASERPLYIMPQDYGNRSDVRSVTVKNREVALEFIPSLPMEISIKDCSIKELQEKWHFREVETADRVYLTLDLFYRGVGTGSCGPAPFEQYRNVGAGEYEFNLLIGAKKI